MCIVISSVQSTPASKVYQIHWFGKPVYNFQSFTYWSVFCLRFYLGTSCLRELKLNVNIYCNVGSFFLVSFFLFLSFFLVPAVLSSFILCLPWSKFGDPLNLRVADNFKMMFCPNSSCPSFFCSFLCFSLPVYWIIPFLWTFDRTASFGHANGVIWSCNRRVRLTKRSPFYTTS